MAFWDRFFTKKEITEVTAPQEQFNPGISEQAASHLIKLSEELNLYKEHGTSDPVLIAQAKVLAESLRNRPGVIDYQVAAAYGSVYTKIADTRRVLIKEVDKMRMFYLVDVLLAQFTEDSLAPEIGTGNVLEISSPKEDLQREIDWLEEKFDIDQLVLAITPDLLLYGEYTLKTKVNPKPVADGRTVEQKKLSEEIVQLIGEPQAAAPNKEIVQLVGPANDSGQKDDPNSTQYGLIELEDTVEQGTVVSLTHYANTTGYLSADSGDNKIKKHEPADFIKFALSSQRMRIDLYKEFQVRYKNGKIADGIPEELKDIPRYIRVGKSLIYPVIAKLKELELLEALVPATKLAKLSSGTVVGVQVPSGYDIQKAMEAAKQVEGVLNKRVGVDQRLGELTIENIMNTAGRLKVVPIFGDKGQLSKLDYQSDEPDELLASVKETRDTICSSMGIPSELLFGSEGESKGAILKKYARYLRKLKAIQKAVEDGVRQIVYIHLVNKGYSFKNEDIKVEFNHKLIEIDNLDNLEFIDTTVGLLKNTKDFITSLANKEENPQFADRVNVDKMAEFLNKQLNVIGFNNIINVKTVDKVGNHVVTKSTGEDPGSTFQDKEVDGQDLDKMTF